MGKQRRHIRRSKKGKRYLAGRKRIKRRAFRQSYGQRSVEPFDYKDQRLLQRKKQELQTIMESPNKDNERIEQLDKIIKSMEDRKQKWERIKFPESTINPLIRVKIKPKKENIPGYIYPEHGLFAKDTKRFSVDRYLKLKKQMQEEGALKKRNYGSTLKIKPHQQERAIIIRKFPVYVRELPMGKQFPNRRLKPLLKESVLRQGKYKAN